MSRLRENKLDFWLEHEYNVLLIGRHGVGKTSIVKSVFDRHELNWRYFSASTLDPWVDFVGVPKEHNSHQEIEPFKIIKELASINLSVALQWIEANWKLTGPSAEKIVKRACHPPEVINYLELTRPKDFADGSIEALFFDEYNRAPKKVRNAVMELVQFKSINGMRFPNLKVVWAAINPEDDEDLTYDVEALDPAQRDRFQVKVEVPYEIPVEYFANKYGHYETQAAKEWWDELPEEEKRKVSPRCLDYALRMFNDQGDLRDVLPVTSNPAKLFKALNQGPISDKLERLLREKSTPEAKLFLSNDNNYTAAIRFIVESETMMEFFLPMVHKEKLSSLMSKNDRVCRFVCNNADLHPSYNQVMHDILDANQNKKLVKKIRTSLQEKRLLATSFLTDDKNPDKPYCGNKPHGKKNWGEYLDELERQPSDTTHRRIHNYKALASALPKNISPEEGVRTLEVLNQTVGRSWADTLPTDNYPKLMGVVNHCLSAIYNDGNNWQEVVQKYGNRFRLLLEKIKEANMADRLLTKEG